MCGALSILYFIITGLQYWMSDYFIVVLGQDETVVFITFSIMSITGPVVGVVVGGNITSCYGGYRAKKSILATLIMACFCIVSAVPIPFLNDFKTAVMCAWLLLFFGGAILPSMTGMMLSTVTVS